MFATSGYYRGVACPYFASGLCERPYCHFRHVQSDRTAAEKLGVQGQTTCQDERPDEAPGRKSSLLNMVGNAIKQVQRDIEIDKAKLGSLAHGSHPHIRHQVAPQRPVYQPTPIKRKPGVTCKLVPEKNSTTRNPKLHRKYDLGAAPAYNPTPIKVLQKQKAKEGTQAEYDPICNFSTKGRATNWPAQRVTLGDAHTGKPPTETSGKDEGAQAAKRTREESSEIEAKFSDDDDDDDDDDGGDSDIQIVDDPTKLEDSDTIIIPDGDHNESSDKIKDTQVVVKQEPVDKCAATSTDTDSVLTKVKQEPQNEHSNNTNHVEQSNEREANNVESVVTFKTEPPDKHNNESKDVGQAKKKKVPTATLR